MIAYSVSTNRTEGTTKTETIVRSSLNYYSSCHRRVLGYQRHCSCRNRSCSFLPMRPGAGYPHLHYGGYRASYKAQRTNKVRGSAGEHGQSQPTSRSNSGMIIGRMVPCKQACLIMITALDDTKAKGKRT